MNTDKKGIKVNLQNVKGKYYVDVDKCDWCPACEIHAPNNFIISPENYEEGAYVFKQPENSEEEDQCEEAMYYCPSQTILDDGEINNQ
jgi:ferredoxin